MKNKSYLLVFLFWVLALCALGQPSNDSIPPLCSGVENLQGQIDCFPFAPNQGQLQVMWTVPEPGCNPVGFYRGDDLDDL